jgi:hypothetical protein
MMGIWRSIWERVSGAHAPAHRETDQDERDRMLGGRGLAEASDSLRAVDGKLVGVPTPAGVQAQDVEVRFLRGTSAQYTRARWCGARYRPR